MWNNTKIVEDQGVSFCAHAKAALPVVTGCAANLMILFGKSGDPAGIRTQGHLIKSQVLYQLSYGINAGERPEPPRYGGTIGGGGGEVNSGVGAGMAKSPSVLFDHIPVWPWAKAFG